MKQKAINRRRRTERFLIKTAFAKHSRWPFSEHLNNFQTKTHRVASFQSLRINANKVTNEVMATLKRDFILKPACTTFGSFFGMQVLLLQPVAYHLNAQRPWNYDPMALYKSVYYYYYWELIWRLIIKHICTVFSFTYLPCVKTVN